MERTIDRSIDAAQGNDGSWNFGGSFDVECGSKGEVRKSGDDHHDDDGRQRSGAW
jgi:hypothetical protein